VGWNQLAFCSQYNNAFRGKQRENGLLAAFRTGFVAVYAFTGCFEPCISAPWLTSHHFILVELQPLSTFFICVI
jgi:hypothetical protein